MKHRFVAVIEMTSCLGTYQHIVKGNSPSELIEAFENVQSLYCLVRTGRNEEGPEVQESLDILENLLNKVELKELAEEDFKSFDIKTSSVHITFMESFVGKNNEERLKEKYPNAK